MKKPLICVIRFFVCNHPMPRQNPLRISVYDEYRLAERIEENRVRCLGAYAVDIEQLSTLAFLKCSDQHISTDVWAASCF